MMLISIKSNTVYQYLSNTKIQIPTTQDILLFILMPYAIVLFFMPRMRFCCSPIRSFVCKTFEGIISELPMFEMGK